MYRVYSRCSLCNFPGEALHVGERSVALRPPVPDISDVTDKLTHRIRMSLYLINILFTCIVHALKLTVKAFLGMFSWHNLHFTGRVGHDARWDASSLWDPTKSQPALEQRIGVYLQTFTWSYRKCKMCMYTEFHVARWNKAPLTYPIVHGAPRPGARWMQTRKHSLFQITNYSPVPKTLHRKDTKDLEVACVTIGNYISTVLLLRWLTQTYSVDTGISSWNY